MADGGSMRKEEIINPIPIFKSRGLKSTLESN